MLCRLRYYFENTHRAIPIIDRNRFLARISIGALSADMIGLRYAVCAHAASQSRTYQHLASGFYMQARYFLELAESESSITSIPSLQTNILIALYEIKHAAFARAWTSVSRATWLARMIDLHRMDCSSEAEGVAQRRCLLPFTDDPAELEERRKTFWATLHLNCFLNVGIKWGPSMVLNSTEVSSVFTETFSRLTLQITTRLPLDPVEDHTVSPLTLDEALKPSLNNLLAPGQGAVLSLVLCLRCLCHVNQVADENTWSFSPYDFWTQHHHLQELLDHAMEGPLAHLKATCYTTDPAILSLNLIVHATIICISHAALVMIERVKGPSDMIDRCLEQSISSALTIAETTRLVSRIRMDKVG